MEVTDHAARDQGPNDGVGTFTACTAHLGAMAAKTRYRQPDAACELLEPSATLAELHFDQPQWAVTPGQSAVLYRGEVCLGGGVIATSNVQNLS